MEQSMQMLRINARGQITIPTELRKQLGIRAGTVVNCIEENGRLVLIPITARGIREIVGFLKPKPGEPSAFEELFKERARERQREDIKAGWYDAEFKAKKAKGGNHHAAQSQHSSHPSKRSR
jgi:AbrB family looped-hinge helix DNA binding protein